MPTEGQVRTVLRGVTDPELGINVVDLGLIYTIETEGETIRVRMTLTTPTCPLAATLPARVEEALRAAFVGHAVEVAVVWEPHWTPERMSADARRRLGAS